MSSTVEQPFNDMGSKIGNGMQQNNSNTLASTWTPLTRTSRAATLCLRSAILILKTSTFLLFKTSPLHPPQVKMTTS